MNSLPVNQNKISQLFGLLFAITLGIKISSNV